MRAGKFRRYHGEGFKQLLDMPTMLKNARDAVYVLIGIFQSYRLLRRLKPGIIFTRGGFVSVPVALGGKLNHIPYVTHDSDSTPSLANRLIARWAVLHAVALPEEIYPYPIDKTITVGIPVSSKYQPVTAGVMKAYRRELKLDAYQQMVFVTGGGNGARTLNTAIVDNSAYLLKKYPEMVLVHVAGRELEAETKQRYADVLDTRQLKQVIVKGFLHDLHLYSGAADVVIARGGATNLAEFAIQGKACVVVPPNHLIWAVKNTEALAERGAIMMLTEEQAEQERRLASVIEGLLADTDSRQRLASDLASYARPDAAEHLAKLLLEHANVYA